MSATDVIVISSPAEQQPPIYTPRPGQAVTDRLFGLSPHYSSPLTPPSPSELFKDSSRSKYFQTVSPVRAPETTKTGPKKGCEKDSDTHMSKKAATEDKPKRGRKKLAPESQASPGELAPAIPAPGDKATKKPTKTKKRRAAITGKRAESGNQTITGKVAKPGGARGKEAGKKAATESTTTPSEDKDDTTKTEDLESNGLHLEGAVKRRSDWTPPRDTSKPAIQLDYESFENTESTDVSGFGGLLSTYNFSGKTSPPRVNLETEATEDSGPTKRRRIEVCTITLSYIDSVLIQSSS